MSGAPLVALTGPCVDWETRFCEEARENVTQKALKYLNGCRASVWAVCVEKKRADLSSMLGFVPKGPATLPEDCRRHIAEFLGEESSNGEQHITKAEMEKLMKENQTKNVLKEN